MRMKKVLHILTRLIRGGADETVLFLLKGLPQHGFDVSLLIGGDSDTGYVHEASSYGRIVLETSLRRDVKPLSDLLALSRLYRHIRQGAYDIVHTHTAKAGVLGRFAAKMAGVPLVVHTVHGITFHDFRPPPVRMAYLLCEKFAARMTDRFIAVGDDLRRYYLSHAIGRPGQYTVIHTGMNLEKFRQASVLPDDLIRKKRAELHIQPEDRVVGLVSRLDTGKGQEYLLQAVPQIIRQHPQVKFLLVGDGPYRQKFQQMTTVLNIDQHVIFTGFRYDIEEVMTLFDIAAFTSLWEGLPRVIVQYIAVGKPIVAFDIPGVSELIHSNINGFTVPVRDGDRLAKRLSYLLENPDEARMMGQNGKRLLDDSWNVDTMVARIAREYQELMKEKKHERFEAIYQ
jgi:glycosyltransferase involved in cell wall biosynthesis